MACDVESGCLPYLQHSLKTFLFQTFSQVKHRGVSRVCGRGLISSRCVMQSCEAAVWKDFRGCNMPFSIHRSLLLYDTYDMSRLVGGNRPNWGENSQDMKSGCTTWPVKCDDQRIKCRKQCKKAERILNYSVSMRNHQYVLNKCFTYWRLNSWLLNKQWLNIWNKWIMTVRSVVPHDKHSAFFIPKFPQRLATSPRKSPTTSNYLCRL